MLKVAPCTVVRSYIQIFSAWWVTAILYNYGATLCELRYNKVRDWFCHTIYVASRVLIVFEEPNQMQLPELGTSNEMT